MPNFTFQMPMIPQFGGGKLSFKPNQESAFWKTNDQNSCIKRIMIDPSTIPPGTDPSTIEISTKSCEEICLTGEICPELLTVDCDTF